MPNQYKVALIYRLYQQGWTEVYYRTAGTAADAAYISSGRAQNIINIHARQTVFQAVRASNVALPRDTNLTLYNLTNNSPVSGANDPDVTATCALLNISAPPNLRRKLWLRGLPDNFVTRDTTTGRSVPFPGWPALFSSWKNAITGSAMQIQALKPATTIGYTWQSVLSFAAPVGGGGTQVTFSAPHGFVTGDKIMFSRVPMDLLPGLKGQFTAFVVSATVIGIMYLWRGVTTPIYPSVCRARKVGYDYQTIDSIEFQEFLTRQTGRPFGVPRGRARATIRRT